MAGPSGARYLPAFFVCGTNECGDQGFGACWDAGNAENGPGLERYGEPFFRNGQWLPRPRPSCCRSRGQGSCRGMRLPHMLDDGEIRELCRRHAPHHGSSVPDDRADIGDLANFLHAVRDKDDREAIFPGQSSQNPNSRSVSAAVRLAVASSSRMSSASTRGLARSPPSVPHGG